MFENLREGCEGADGLELRINLEYMQYIGLKDKNGKDIYEGDIITDTIDNSVRTWTIFYDPKQCAYIISNIDDPDWYQFLGKPESTFGEIEVIGNIYENKELIKYPSC